MNKLVWLLCIIVLFFSCTSHDIERDLDTYFSQEFKADEPGGAVLVMKGEKVIFSKGYGLADLMTKEKITPSTLFNTGSISKTFVSNTILALAEEGKLSLNDSLYKFFPEFKNTEIAKKIRLYHMLSHTSGLPDNRRNLLDSVYLLTAKDAENWAPIMKNDSLVFEPGSRYEYSNPAFNGLALIIEKISNRKWQEVVKEKIFTPAGMKTSVITDGPFPEKGVSHAYLKVGGKFIEKDYGEEPTFAAAGNGGIWSSAEELAQYELALRKAVFLKKETIDRSRVVYQHPNWKDATPAFIGYSWFIGKTEDGLKVVSHTGTQGGFYCDYVSIPEKELVYVILCNRPVPREQEREDVLAILKKYYWK